MNEVSVWLRALGLERYEQAFRDNAIDLETLPELTDADLEKVGVLLGHRKRMLRAIAALPSPSSKIGELPARPVGAERRQVTIMFSDLVGSTPLSLRLDPEDLRDVLGAYTAAVTEAIEKFDGTVNRYMGDGVLTCFGYPQAHEDDAERAIRAGLLLIDTVSRLEFAWGRLEVRVGIATGLVIIGDLIGSGDAQERGIVGETPNLAYRLQGLAAPNSVMISEGTRQLAGKFFEYRDLGLIEVKGFSNKIPVWQALRPSGIENRFEALRASSLTRFVGRADELALLRGLWERAKAADGQVVHISGEPGIGKSRLVAALSEPLRREPCVRLRFFCSPYHTSSTLYPVITHIERAAGFAAGDSPETKYQKLETLLSRSATDSSDAALLFADLMGLPTNGQLATLDPQQKRERVLAAAMRQLEAWADEHPVLLIFEDAHWIDSTSRLLLEMITERVSQQAVLMVVTARPEFHPPWAGRPQVTSLALSRLGRRQTAQLAEHVAHDKKLPDPILDRIIERTDGIPLFVEELTKTVLEGDLLHEEPDRYRLDGPLPHLAIPTSLHGSLMARLDRLSSVKEVAQIGAALGREFSFEVLAAVGPQRSDQLAQAIDQLASAGLIFCRGVPPRASIIFKHALIQDAAYGTLLRSERQELHARIGQTLETQFAGSGVAEPEILAHHYTQAGLVEQAIEHWQRAGERALRRSAHVEAVAHLTKGIELISLLPATAERDRQELRLYLVLGPAMRAINGHATDDVLGVYSRARELLRQDTTVREQIGVLYGLWIIQFTRWDTGTHGLAQEIRALGERHRDVEATTLGTALTGNTQWGTGDFVESRYNLEQSLKYSSSIIGTSGGRALHNHRVAALSFLGVTLWPMGFPLQAANAAERALTEARETGHVPLTALALHNQAFLVASFGADPDLIGVDPAEAEAYCVDHGVAAYEPWVRYWRGAMLARNDPEDAIKLMERAMEAAAEIGAGLFRSVQLGHLGTAYAHIGQSNAGLELLADAIRLAQQKNARFFLAELYRLRGEIFAAVGNISEAEADLRRAMSIASAQHAHLWELRAACSLSRLLLNAGKWGDAHTLLAPVYDWFSEGLETADLIAARLLLDDLLQESAAPLEKMPSGHSD